MINEKDRALSQMGGKHESFDNFLHQPIGLNTTRNYLELSEQVSDYAKASKYATIFYNSAIIDRDDKLIQTVRQSVSTKS